ncbi:HAD-IB family phosphatase [Helicobacter saguini]|uniref:phosphoserine phosphatase n=1 Tax=Helicobacter saguini TaxID=1548018 RepID=A0A347VPV0_9HELI|nr:HAD-IB family phosphatase [Helicobacter saguini]MWV61201.1 HAD-IB family phosphatase [Helicobacter saguini]MWV68132.1 HAD-IB family phosphatase [Helicobacter saguini]MWV70404.1 HAD-IB family phosphatase [Helicobacter saguini]MWV72306.1 HAD-IB family phosphatase [Helicobacter saguini]TLD95343.1 HAD family hydrolase [Helicobacter saguini]
MAKFIFDLDGTITKEETLPKIASHFNLQDKIDNLTKETIKGNIPFIESFIRRIHILSQVNISEISNLLENTTLYTKLLDFIHTNPQHCIIATQNLSCYIDKLLQKIGCCYYSSSAITKDDKVVKIKEILKKENIVKHYKDLGEKVVFIGDGNNDVEAMRLANISIASGLTHTPANSVLSIADYLVLSEEALCRQLNQLL